MLLDDQEKLIEKTKNDTKKEWSDKYNAIELILEQTNEQITLKTEHVEKLEN